MNWDYAIKFTDVAIVIATLVGPVLAVQSQKWLETYREMKQRRQRVFHSLMSTRATRLASLHVEALNSIEIEFYGVKEVIKAHRSYIDILNAGLAENSSEAIIESWSARRDDMFVDLLHSMSSFLGYDFDKVQIRRGVYYPTGHGDLEKSMNQIREGFGKVLSGEQPIAMRVVELPRN